MRRFWLFVLLLGCIVIGCTPTPTPVAEVSSPTLQGPVVPTRVPTATTDASSAPTDTAEVPPTPQPSDTPIEVTSQANLPTDTVTNTIAPPENTSTPVEPGDTATATFTTAPTETPTDEPSPTETASVAPTNTVAPSNTPTEAPTNTPAPTSTNTLEPTTPPTATFTPLPTAQTAARYADSTAFLPVSLESQIDTFSSMIGVVDDDNPARLYPYVGSEGEIINIALRSTDDGLDPSLLVIDPKGRELVRNENESDDSYDAAIRGFRVPENGTYVIVATRYGQQFGFSSGEFELNVSKASATTEPFGFFSQPIPYGGEVTGTIEDDIPAFIYTFRGGSGDTVSIQMTATSDDLDPRLFLTDNLGNVLSANDDDLYNLTIDSYIQSFVLPASGYYSIIATHYEGAPNSGDFRLTLTLEESGTPGTIHPIYAVLNMENSHTLRADGQFFSNFSAGDSVNADKNELRTESLLTFFLPPLPENVTLESAILELAPCYETGSGFAALGPLTIYLDNYGSFAQTRDFTHPGAGARILAEMEACESLDLTEVAREAYADSSEIQLRLTFRSASSNEEGDEVVFTPRLLLNLAE